MTAMNRAVRTLERPARNRRLPVYVPLSLFIRATPTSAAISLRLSCPSSGSVKNLSHFSISGWLLTGFKRRLRFPGPAP